MTDEILKYDEFKQFREEIIYEAENFFKNIYEYT